MPLPRPHSRANPHSAFSLVEISIVLVLVSLIAGGIMAGLNIKHSAELKSINDEIGNFRQMVGAFKDRYEGLPGDLYNATKFWGMAAGSDSACKTTPSNDVKTCNGDGNGMITTAGDASTFYEAHRFWQHLSNAEFLDGRFTGQRAGSSTNANCLSHNHCAQSDYRNGTYYPATLRDSEDYFRVSGLGGLYMFPGEKGNAIVLFRNSNNTSAGGGGAFIGAPLLTAEDAFNLDTKYDDSKPATGHMQSFEPFSDATSYLSNACATTNDPLTARYNLDSKGGQCALIFTQLF